MNAGTHNLMWDGKDQQSRITASGVYFAQVRSRGEALAAKLARVK